MPTTSTQSSLMLDTTQNTLSTPKALYSWPTSPFGAKVKACLAALNLNDVKIIPYHPWQNDHVLRALNPLNKIPVLILEKGEALYDSPVICEYLNHYAKGGLIPTDKKFSVLKIQALCDGILDAGVSLRYEMYFRPEALRSQDWMERQMQAVKSGVSALSQEPLENTINLATICTAITLFYLELRMPKEFSAMLPQNLHTWFQEMREHPIFTKTKPMDTMPLPQGILTLLK